MTKRNVRVGDEFFADLDGLLPRERGPDGTPSTTDFLLYEIPRLIERLGEDYEAVTHPLEGAPHVRVLVTSGMLVPYIAAYTTVDDWGNVDLVGLEITSSPT